MLHTFADEAMNTIRFNAQILKNTDGNNMPFFRGEMASRDISNGQFYTSCVDAAKVYADSDNRILTSCFLKMKNPIIVDCCYEDLQHNANYAPFTCIPLHCIQNQNIRNKFSEVCPKYFSTDELLHWSMHNTRSDGIIFINVIDAVFSNYPIYECCIWNQKNIVARHEIDKNNSQRFLKNAMNRIDLSAYGINGELRYGVLHSRLLNGGCTLEDRLVVNEDSLKQYRMVVIPHGADAKYDHISVVQDKGLKEIAPELIEDTGSSFEFLWESQILGVQIQWK